MTFSLQQNTERKRVKKKRQEVSLRRNSESPSLGPEPEPEPLPLDAAARSDGESVYEEVQTEKPKKKQAERRMTSRRPTQRASTDQATGPAEPLLPEVEPTYVPLTASGLPVVIEAANKRLMIMKAEAERKRLEEEAKSKRKKVPEMRSKSSRALTAPFGMPMPNIVGSTEMVSSWMPRSRDWLTLIRCTVRLGWAILDTVLQSPARRWIHA